jgi:hypothetical protein
LLFKSSGLVRDIWAATGCSHVGKAAGELGRLRHWWPSIITRCSALTGCRHTCPWSSRDQENILPHMFPVQTRKYNSLFIFNVHPPIFHPPILCASSLIAIPIFSMFSCPLIAIPLFSMFSCPLIAVPLFSMFSCPLTDHPQILQLKGILILLTVSAITTINTKYCLLITKLQVQKMACKKLISTKYSTHFQI